MGARLCYYCYCHRPGITVFILNHTLKATQSQVAIMQTGERPWVGVIGINIQKQPSFQFLPQLHIPAVSIGSHDIVKNYGKTPALNELDSLGVFATDSKTEPNTPFQKTQEALICSASQEVSEHRAGIHIP